MRRSRAAALAARSCLAAFGFVALGMAWLGPSLVGPSSLARAEVATPAPGSAERKDIIDAVRVPMQLSTRGPVIFKVGEMNVERPWAFFRGDAIRPDGTAIRHEGTAFEDEAGFMDGWTIYAVLYHENGRWNLLDHHVAPTDVSWFDWLKRFGVPCRVAVPAATGCKDAVSR